MPRLRRYIRIPIVAADVSPLIISAGEKFEPTHVGCYTSLGDDGNQMGALSALLAASKQLAAS
jgi:hypothetical protein